MKEFLIRRWFLIALAASLLAGVMIGPSGSWLADMSLVRNTIVFVVLFAMAWPLSASNIWDSIRRPLAPGIGVAINFGVLPLCAWGGAQLLSTEMATGFLVAAAAPCTLASAAVWTRRAGGNDASAILVTIVTNLLCFVVTPLWIFATVGADVPISLVAMISKLGWLVVLPITLAQLTRVRSSIASWATSKKKTLGVVAQSGILCMVFLGALRTGESLRQSGDQAPNFVNIGVMIIAVLTLHLGMFFLGMWFAKLCKVKQEDAIAVGFSGSQKTLMVGLQICLDLGVSILPMVAYHVGQLLVDTVIADRLNQTKDEKP